MGVVGKDIRFLLFFCMHVSTHACMLDGRKEVVLFQTAGAGEFSFISIVLLYYSLSFSSRPVPASLACLGISV